MFLQFALVPFLLFIAAIAGWLLAAGLRQASALLFFPNESVELFVVRAYHALPWVIAVLVGLTLGIALRGRRWIGPLLALALFAGAECNISLNRALGQGFFVGQIDAYDTVLTLPDGIVDLPMSRWTAAELNGHVNRFGITYVGPTEPSTGPFVVSVNPIDDHAFGSAALSRHGHCYLMLTVWEPASADHFFGTAPDGRPCLGALATRETVTSRDLSPWRSP